MADVFQQMFSAESNPLANVQQAHQQFEQLKGRLHNAQQTGAMASYGALEIALEEDDDEELMEVDEDTNSAPSLWGNVFSASSRSSQQAFSPTAFSFNQLCMLTDFAIAQPLVYGPPGGIFQQA